MTTPTPSGSSSTRQESSTYRSLRTKSSCCACKHQRRRCSSTCALAPYFPPEKNRDFQNVHKLFGLHNVVNLLNEIPQDYKEDAMKSICYEANMRANNPVGGCFSMILELHRQIIQTASELEAVKEQLSRIYDHLLQEKNQDNWQRMFLRDSGAGEGSSMTHQFNNQMINQFNSDLNEI